MHKVFIGLLCCILFSVKGFSQGIVFMENPQWEKVLETAKQQNKLLFVDCYTEWCGPCQGLIRNVFPKKEVGDYYNKHFVCVKYDMEKQPGMDFKKKYPNIVEAYPTLLFIAPTTGKIIHKFIGMRQPEELIAEAERCFSGDGTVELQKLYDAGERSFAFMQEYVQSVANSVRDRSKVVELIDSYCIQYDTLSTLMRPDKWNFYSRYIWDVRAKYVQYIITNYSRIVWNKFVDKRKLDEDLENCIRLAINRFTAIEAEKSGGALALVEDDSLYHLLHHDLRVLNNLPGREECYFKLYTYRLLLDEKWEDVFYAVNNGVAFQFKSAKRYKEQVYNYLITQVDDKKILGKIYEDVLMMQKEGEKQFRYYNYYGCIAAVADKLGLKKEAAKARAESERITLEREKVFGKPKVYKGNH